MTNARFTARDWERSNSGKAPKGWGGWFFQSETGAMFTFTGNFSEAKRAAQAWANENGFLTFEARA